MKQDLMGNCALGVVACLLTLNIYATDAVLCVPPPAPGNIGDVTALINCITTANAEGGGTINLGGLTYTLTAADNTVDGANGLPDIISHIIIENGTITKDETLPFRHLHISSTGSLSLKKVTLTNGNDTSGSGGGALYVAPGGILGTVENCNISNNQAVVTSGVARGGAIVLDGEFFEIRKSFFSNNQAATEGGEGAGSIGGAIYIAGGGGVISESIFTANSANDPNSTNGGAIYVEEGASIEAIVRTSFIANASPASMSGAIYVDLGPGIGTIDGCTFSFNSSPAGGAILLNGPVGTLSNTTFDNNSASGGGALLLNDAGGPYIGSVNLIYNCTFTGNVAANQGGAIFVSLPSTIGQFFNNTAALNFAGAASGGAGMFNCGTIGAMVSNIWAENFDANTMPGTEDDVNNCGSGAISTASFNLVGVDTNTNNAFTNGINGNVGNIVGTASSPIKPNLGVLRDNGGPTKTMALLSNSPAIGSGQNPLGLPDDQRGRGFSRMVHGQTDIGAFEVQLTRDCR